MDYGQLVSNTVPQTLSRLTPPIDYFSEFMDNQGPYDRYKLMECVIYHEAVANFFAFQKAEAFGMLGFCHERLGQQNEAIDAYNQAISLNPDYFWPYYDLGVIYYREGKYSRAGEYFQKALEVDPIKTIVLLSRSKVYNDVKLSESKGSYDYLEGLKQGRQTDYLLMMDCLYRLRQLQGQTISRQLSAQVRFF